MNINHDEELAGMDLADDVLAAIERDYGRTIYRIPKFKPHPREKHCFNISVIFTDFRLLEGKIRVRNLDGMTTIEVHGIYY